MSTVIEDLMQTRHPVEPYDVEIPIIRFYFYRFSNFDMS